MAKILMGNDLVYEVPDLLIERFGDEVLLSGYPESGGADLVTVRLSSSEVRKLGAYLELLKLVQDAEKAKGGTP